MPAYKDEERGTWYAKFYYTDYYGNKQQKKKRGFKTKREAKAYEDNFLANEAKAPSTLFSDLLDKYYIYIQTRIEPTTLETKQGIMNNHIIPVFKDIPINKITPEMVLVWQDELRLKPGTNNRPLKASTVNIITGQFSAVMNYAVKYYHLPSNPFLHVEKDKVEKEEMNFWEINQFNNALRFCKSQDIEMILLLKMLFFGGFRIGELQAITPADLLDNEMSVNINKTYKTVKRKWVKGPPKSENSYRRVPLPEFLWKELKTFVGHCYGMGMNDDIFNLKRSTIQYRLDIISEKSGQVRLRIHDLRHSHVAYLISLGFTFYEIADRIGDTVAVVEQTYAHLYPNKRIDVAKRIHEKASFSQNSTKIVPQPDS